MFDNPVLSAAFIVATVAFFKKQFGFDGKLALLCSFIVALIVALEPLAEAAFPAVAPWLKAVFGVVFLFVGSSGSYDAISAFIKKSQP